MSKNSLRLWIIGSIFLAIGVAPFLAQGDQATVQRVEKNRQAISRMTESERDRLERNFAAYQSMSPEKRTELRSFHQKIENDRNSNSGELNAALQQYDEWLATIEPLQRDQLKIERDPQKRLKLMSEIVKEQRTRDVTSVIRRRFDNSPLANVPVLAEAELLDLLGKIEEIEHGKLSLSQQSDLNRKEGIPRFLYFLEKLKENARSRPQDRSKVPRWVVREFVATSTMVESKLDQLIPNEVVRNYLRKDEREVPARFRIQAVILKSILIQVMKQEGQAATPPQQQLEELFNSLPEEEQDDLLQLEAIDFIKDLLARIEPSDPEQKTLSHYDVMKAFFGDRDIQRHRPPEKRPPPISNGERPPNGHEDRPRGGPEDRERNGFRGPRRPDDRGPNGRFRRSGNQEGR